MGFIQLFNTFIEHLLIARDFVINETVNFCLCGVYFLIQGRQKISE